MFLKTTSYLLIFLHNVILSSLFIHISTMIHCLPLFCFTCLLLVIYVTSVFCISFENEICITKETEKQKKGCNCNFSALAYLVCLNVLIYWNGTEKSDTITD